MNHMMNLEYQLNVFSIKAVIKINKIVFLRGCYYARSNIDK